MAEYDESARENGYCGYIGDGRKDPCKLVEGWGYENTSSGLCENHGERGGLEGNQNALGNSGGGAPPANDNAVTHGAFADRFKERLTDGEREAYADVLDSYETEDGRRIAMEMIADYALKYQRSGDPRFGRRYEALHDLIIDDEDGPDQHAHIHQNHADGDHELTDQQRADIQAMFEDRGRTRTEDPDFDTDTNTNVIDVEPVGRHEQDRTLDIEVDETVSTAAPDADDDPGSGPEKKREVRFDW